MSISVIDLFCGVGGLTKGLELAGLNVVAGFDLDKTCSYAYENNNHAIFFHRDITTITGEDITNLYPKNDVRVLVGCAPCQPFSKLTKRYRKEEKHKGRKGDTWQKDSKWRLLYQFSRLIDEAKPQIVSMENVPDLVHEQVFLDFIRFLEDRKYHVSFQIVFCPDYGVPQNRKRLVLLASQIGEIKLIKRLHTPENYLTVRHAIGNLTPIVSGETCQSDSLHRSARLNSANIARIRHSVPGGTWRDWDKELILNCHRKATGKSYGSVYGRMEWDAPSPTITTQFYGYGNGRFGHPEQDRAISYREGALLQSFPPDYVFFDPKEEKFNSREIGIHIGNAVPVELGKTIGMSILKHIKEEFNNA